MDDPRGAGRPVDQHRPAQAAEVEAEEGIEAGDVVEVEMREEEGVNHPDLGGRERIEAARAAVEEEAPDGPPCGDADEQRIIAARIAEHLILDTHDRCSPPPCKSD